ncbi:MAG: arginine--tRNA ligase [Patescibacteria group bacterium]|nr:arginine--tRNA ligase [Patescibacteria group bacterium]
MIREEIRILFKKVLKEMKIGDFEIVIEHPEVLEHGDYATNIALVAAPKLGRSPRELAQEIAEKIKEQKSKFIEKVEVAGPGFINIFLSRDYLVNEFIEVIKQKEKYGRGDELKGKKIIVEFTDPNPFKEFHIGHLYSNIVGESISRLLEANGANIRRVNYQGDVGMHVAKAIWGMEKKKASLTVLSKKTLEEKMEFLGQSYALGNTAFENNKKAKEEITELNQKIFDLNKDIKDIYEKGRKWSLDYFEEMYKRLGTKFDSYYFERDSAEVGLKIVKEGLKKGVFEESEGAVIYPGEKKGLHNRVFINSKGLPTYEAKELGLALTKYKDFEYDLSIIITGNEIIGYFKVLLSALKEMEPELGEKTNHIAHGMVRMSRGKMSSRTGTIILAKDLLDEMKSRVVILMESSEIQKVKGVEEQVAVGAVKYSLLRVGIGKDIIFDIEKSLSIEGDSGPYIQYTYARCKSILRKAKVSKKTTYSDFSLQEQAILRQVYRFQEYVKEAGDRFSPNLIASFSIELAQAYNSFYNTHRVLQAENKEQKNFRIMLTAAVAQLLSNSLYLLGIETPEQM